MSNRYQTALDVQDACNPSGVGKLFERETHAFMDSPDYKGTDSVRNDPALRLIAYKLCELMGICASLEPAYDKAFAECEAKAKESVNAAEA
jgi:hypothetical protein